MYVWMCVCAHASNLFPFFVFFFKFDEYSYIFNMAGFIIYFMLISWRIKQFVDLVYVACCPK